MLIKVILHEWALKLINNTVYQEIFMSLYSYEFHKFCSVAKLNFAKVLPCHPFYVAHVDHLHAKLLKSPFSRKFSDTKISQYSVYFLMEPHSVNKMGMDQLFMTPEIGRYVLHMLQLLSSAVSHL